MIKISVPTYKAERTILSIIQIQWFRILLTKESKYANNSKIQINHIRPRVNDTLRMYKNDDIRMYNFDCITDTIVEVITTCNTYTLLTVHLL